MNSQIINISLPKELVAKIDRAAKAQYSSRSEYIRQAILSRLQSQDKQLLWEALEAEANSVSASASSLGYTSDEDFSSAVKNTKFIN